MLNIQIENLVFLTIRLEKSPGPRPRGFWRRGRVGSARVGVHAGARGLSSSAPRTLTGHLWWKLPALGVLYIVLFLVAGSLILPYIRDFYGRTNLIVMPPFGVLLLTEFIRGLVHVISLWPFLRTMSGRRLQAAVLAGLALPILGGISSLLLPIDDILPPAIRRVHIVEIFGSNFVFGVITAGLLVRRRDAAAPRFAVVDGHALGPERRRIRGLLGSAPAPRPREPDTHVGPGPTTSGR